MAFRFGPQGYDWVQIGTQKWKTRNLDVTTYRNGDVIPQVTDPTAWVNLTTGAWCYYNNDAANGPIYGKLYNWYAVNDIRGLAPTGYHVPSDAEWTILTDFLGGEVIAGGKMKEAGLDYWIAPNTADNSSRFTALPGGYHYLDGAFYNIGYYGSWWSSTEDFTTIAWFRLLYFNYSYVYRDYSSKTLGFSVRCIKD